MYLLAVALYVLICFFLLVVVLLQQGKGGDIAAAFGGSSSQTAFGARAGATVLTRATAVLGSLFMIGAFVLGVMNRGGGSSVVSGVQGPATTPTAPALNFTPTSTPTPPAQTPAPSSSPSPATQKPAASPPPSSGRGGGS